MNCVSHVFVGGSCVTCGLYPGDKDRPTYTDDIVAVMRDTISAQREAIAAKNAVIAQLEQTLAEGAQTMALAKAIVDADRALRAEAKHDDALDLLARVRNYSVVDSFDTGTRLLGLEREIDEVLARHGRHP